MNGVISEQLYQVFYFIGKNASKYSGDEFTHSLRQQ